MGGPIPDESGEWRVGSAPATAMRDNAQVSDNGETRASGTGSGGRSATRPSPLVLIVDDDLDDQSRYRTGLEAAGFRVAVAADADAAKRMVHDLTPALMVLDLSLPGADGLTTLRQIRDEGVELAVIVLTRTDSDSSRVLLLDSGADDYVVKPVSNDELAARVRAVLRRTRNASLDVIRHGELEIDLRSRCVTMGGRDVELTAKEFDLLAALAAEPRMVFSREKLLEQVWQSRPDWQTPRTVNEHIRRLRLKIEPEPEAPRHLVTVRNVGYRFEP